MFGISEAIFIADIYFCNFFEWLSIFLDFFYYKNSKIFGVDFVILYKVFDISSLKFVLLFYVRKVFDISLLKIESCEVFFEWNIFRREFYS